MNENKKMMIMVVIIIAIVALIPITAIVTSIKSGKILEEVNEYIKDEDYKVEMSSQKISELENNSIKIKVSVNNKEYQEYVVNVKVVEKEKTDQQQLDVDKSEFKGNNSYKVKWIGMIVILISVIVLSILFSKKSK